MKKFNIQDRVILDEMVDNFTMEMHKSQDESELIGRRPIITRQYWLEMIKQVQDENDTRKKNLFLDREGKIFFDVVYNSQKKRIFNALKNSSSDSVIKFKDVLKKIIHGK